MVDLVFSIILVKSNNIEKDVLTPTELRELKKRVADAKNPVRYAVHSDITGDGRWRFWLDVTSDGFWNTIDNATLFKREHVARAVARAYSKRGVITYRGEKVRIISVRRSRKEEVDLYESEG